MKTVASFETLNGRVELLESSKTSYYVHVLYHSINKDCFLPYSDIKDALVAFKNAVEHRLFMDTL